MSPHRTSIRLSRAVVVACLLASSGCATNEEPPPPPAVAAVKAPAIAPVDHARPGEIAEGTELAFGLPVPRQMTVKARFASALFAQGSVPPELVANYVRERVVADHVETGPSKTVFSGARLAPRKTKTGEPMEMDEGLKKLVLRIEVSTRGGGTELSVRDETPPPIPEGLNQEDALKQYGLTAEGKLIDPSRAE